MSKTSLTTFCLFLGKNIASDSKARSCLIFMTWIIEFVTNESQAKHVCYILWQTLMYYVCSTTIFIGSLLCSQEHEPNGKAYKICRINFIFRTMSGELFFIQRRCYYYREKTVVNVKGFTIHSKHQNFPTHKA